MGCAFGFVAPVVPGASATGPVVDVARAFPPAADVVDVAIWPGFTSVLPWGELQAPVSAIRMASADFFTAGVSSLPRRLTAQRGRIRVARTGARWSRAARAWTAGTPSSKATEGRPLRM